MLLKKKMVNVSPKLITVAMLMPVLNMIFFNFLVCVSFVKFKRFIPYHRGCRWLRTVTLKESDFLSFLNQHRKHKGKLFLVITSGEINICVK